MKKFLLAAAFAVIAGISANASDHPEVNPMDVSLKTDVRPSATPLVTVDPYLSIWSFSDDLTASPTVHWTGKESPLISYVRVDGKTYRVLGSEDHQVPTILPTGVEAPWNAKILKGRAPSGDWTAVKYDDSSWQSAYGGVGTLGKDGVRTEWDEENSDIWVRRTFTLEKAAEGNLFLEYAHDDDVEIYINGIEVLKEPDCETLNSLALPKKVIASLRSGKNVIAAHCHNGSGPGVLDFGLKKELPACLESNAAKQKGLSVLPTRTIYKFECGPVDLHLIFTAPLLLDNLDLISRPVNYITWQVKSNDGAEHSVQVYFAASPKQAVDRIQEAVTGKAGSSNGISFACAGTKEQNILGKSGDDVRIDWGYVYVAAPKDKGKTALAPYDESLERFIADGVLASGVDEFSSANAKENLYALSYSNDLGKVGSEVKADYVMIGYDDIYSIQYFWTNLRPYWNRSGQKTITGQFALAAAEYDNLIKKCIAFDSKLIADATCAGGKEYSELCCLAYRQAAASHKLVQSPEGEILFFSKECFSNGSIGTVDITYPSSPMFLYYNPELVKGMMNPIFDFCESDMWSNPFSAHDVGTYPLANGHAYGGNMPVEESGNMLITTAAVAMVEGNASYAQKHWDILTTWANYLVEKGLDPENQLCTDDFAGHLAHNANLSIKAILGIASYSKLAGMLGMKDVASEYMATAKKMASAWKTMAADGDHYKLAFDKEGTWSQKYNLVWDKILGFNIFDPSIAKTEVAYYLSHQNAYGLPLDCRKTYTKTDWILWTATLADSMKDFQAIIEPVYRFQNETEDRVPMSDWIFTDSKKHVGFQNRTVVGGYFLKMLSDRPFYPKNKDSFRIVTYNVGAFSKYQDNSTPMVAAMMNEIDADVVGLNELDSVNTRHNVFQLKELATALGGWDLHFGRAMGFAGGAYGNGIVSKSKILNKYVVTLDKGKGAEQRSMVVVETDKCVFATAHLDHTSEEARVAQAKIINKWIRSHYASSTKPVFFSGDMNAEPFSETISLLKEDWDVISVAGNSFDSSDPYECIDYIFHYKNSAPVKVLGSAVLTDFRKGDVTKASDHLPVYVDVEF